MVDYLKLWIENIQQIQKIVNNPIFDFKGNYSTKTGEVKDYPLKSEWKNFMLELKSETRLEITGSLHKYWNNGSNENDCNINDCKNAIDKLCKEIDLNPTLAKIINIEIGVNLKPMFNASVIINDILCYQNKLPSWPYNGKSNHYFIDIKNSNHYLKIYDKGKQYKTENIFRIEYKEMRSATCAPEGVDTIYLSDLFKREILQVLGSKLIHYFKNLVFTDSTIDVENLNRKDNYLFLKLNNPNNWKVEKGIKPASNYREKQRFINLIKLRGERNIYNHLTTLIESKIYELININNCIGLLPNYSGNSEHLLPVRKCQTCGKDISHQKKDSLHCGEKYIGKKAAKKCRNDSNNFKIKLGKITARGVLFDITPFIVPRKKIN